MKSHVLLLMMAGALPVVLPAAEVHVVQRAVYGDTVEQLSDDMLYTGTNYVTQTAPKLGGYIFTHWSTSATEGLDNRDVFGRARDVARYMLYDTTTLTANYVDDTLDSDGDGVLDGDELYWYGNLDQTATSDTDGDGVGFAQELLHGTNPHFADWCNTGVAYADSDEWLYNPNRYARYVFRSEPEGELFDTVTGYALPGTELTTPSCSHMTSFFGYWQTEGQRVCDIFGRAADAVSFQMPTQDVTYVAVSVADDLDREKLYWYGRTDIALDSDTDGDGKTLAEELTAGTNPLMPERRFSGVVWKDSESWLYNPSNVHQYVIRSDPEGTLFDTITGYAAPGTELTTPTCNHLTSFFGYWSVNGVRQADVFGRALDSLSLTMPNEDVEIVAVYVEEDLARDQMYWYGFLQDTSSDTDGDGKTFAEELTAGTNPLIPERRFSGVVHADAADQEMNLQPYEQARGLILANQYAEMFTSPTYGNGSASMTFAEGAAVWPVVADVNGDGLWDLIVCSELTTNVFVNVGSLGNPEFEPRGAQGLSALPEGALEMNSTAKLGEMTLDVEAVNALSATTNGTTLLVSDADGRIWYYLLSDTNYQLQHKVWGGSFAGFANGLRLAAVDWEDDGDLDCLCGTAEGKLMLLRNPKVGRPTNLKASTGVNNVVLSWDPNAQSRIRGYKVYRGAAAGEATAEDFDSLVSPYTPLPTYRDQPNDLTSEYDYKVSSVSRFYRAGNSTPIVSESVATEPVRVAFGGVTVTVNDAAGFAGQDVDVFVSVNNTLGLTGENLMLSLAYDPAVLTPKSVTTTGLTEGLTPTDLVGEGTWDFVTTAGDITPGEGRAFILTFTAAESAGKTNTPVTITQATLRLKDNKASAARVTYVNGVVSLEAYNPPPPVHAAVSVAETVTVDAGASFTLPAAVTGEGVDASSFTYAYDFDGSILALTDGTFTAASVTQTVTTVIALKDVGVQATEKGREVVLDSVGSCTVVIQAAAVETEPGDGEDIGDTDDGDDEDFEDWSENLTGITRFGTGAFGVGDAQGRVGEEVSVGITLRSGLLFRDLTVDYSKFRFRLVYDPLVLEPVGVAANAGTYDWSAKDGVLTVCGRSGSATIGRHPAKVVPLAIRFRLREQYAVRTTAVAPLIVQARTADGAKIFTPIRWFGTVAIDFTRPTEDPTVVAPWSLGDLNGDGRLTKEDRQLLAQLMQGNGKKVTEYHLRAGDYNGNGRLDNGDYQLLTEDFRNRGIIH